MSPAEPISSVSNLETAQSCKLLTVAREVAVPNAKTRTAAKRWYMSCPLNAPGANADMAETSNVQVVFEKGNSNLCFAARDDLQALSVGVPAAA
jgi:hypothetical protein